MSTPTTTIEPKKESLGISAALILSLVGLTLLLVIAILIKREIRRGNVKSKRDGHFWWCEFFRRYIESKSAKDGKIPAKARPQWLLVGHHELPAEYYTKNECPQYIARMFTIDLYTVFQNTCRETFNEVDSTTSLERYLVATYPSLNDTIHTFRRLKTRAEVDLVPFTFEETKRAIEIFNELLQKLSEFAENPYLREREVDLTLFNRLDDQVQMSSKYIPLLPKDLCQIPLRPSDEDSLGNRNKRSRSKGRFPFHLPSFLHKKKLFSSKSSNTPSQLPTNNRNQSITTTENSFDESNHRRQSSLDRQTRHRSKRSTATDAIPLVEFHDALSNSTTFASDNEQHT